MQSLCGQSSTSGFLKTSWICLMISLFSFSSTTLSSRLALLRISCRNWASMRWVFSRDSLRLASSTLKRRELSSSEGMPMEPVTQRLSPSTMSLRLTSQAQWMLLTITATMSCSSKGTLPMRQPMLTQVISSSCRVTSLKKKWPSSRGTSGSELRQRLICLLTGHSADLLLRPALFSSGYITIIECMRTVRISLYQYHLKQLWQAGGRGMSSVDQVEVFKRCRRLRIRGWGGAGRLSIWCAGRASSRGLGNKLLTWKMCWK